MKMKVNHKSNVLLHTQWLQQKHPDGTNKINKMYKMLYKVLTGKKYEEREKKVNYARDFNEKESEDRETCQTKNRRGESEKEGDN